MVVKVSSIHEKPLLGPLNFVGGYEPLQAQGRREVLLMHHVKDIESCIIVLKF